MRVARSTGARDEASMGGKHATGTDFAALRSEMASSSAAPAGLDFDDIAFGQWDPGEWEEHLRRHTPPLPVVPLFRL